MGAMIGELEAALDGLNPAQREAVEWVDGPLLIIAGPGSGKTRVITHRIAYLMQACGVSPYGILAMTFTNKAARELQRRLESLAGPRSEALTAGTFHSFCARLLRRDGEAVGLPPNYSIYDQDDQTALVKEALHSAGFDSKAYPPRAVLGVISRAKSQLQDPERLALEAPDYFTDICASAYRHYTELLARNNAVDFDDLLLRAVDLLQQYPRIRQRYQERYSYLLVDEFQDTNVAQYRLAQLLAGAQRNICVVGDPDQSIYSWRSADIRNILSFQDDYPGAKVVSLGQNYRSTAAILGAAQGLIAANGQRIENPLFTDQGRGELLQLHEAYNEEDEAGYVINEITRLARQEEFALGDFAVMYRVNAQSRALEEACLQQGMKYRLVGGVRFYQRREIKELLAYLRLLHNPQDDVSLLRVINVPPRGIGAQSLRRLGDWAAAQQLPLFPAMQQLTAQGGNPAQLPARARSAIAAFTQQMERLTRLSREAPVVRLVDLTLEETGLADFVRNSDDRPEERWENLRGFRSLAEEFNAEDPPDGLASLLERVSLVADVDSYEEAEDSITLITLHQAKGLEFPVVFIVGLEEGLLPHNRSLDDPAQLEEERRLCYVGLTRAERRLYLLRAFRRGFRGPGAGGPASRFLREIPPELLAAPAPPKAAAARPANRPPSLTPSLTAGQLAAQMAPGAPPPSRPAPKIGDAVRHTHFGEGVVTGLSPTVADVEVTVEFAGGVGPKRLLLSFAPLEILGG